MMVVLSGNNSNCDAGDEEDAACVFWQSAAIHRVGAGFSPKVRGGDAAQSNLGDLHAGQLSAPAPTSRLLHHSPLRHGTHQDLRKRKRTITGYCFGNLAQGKLNFWREAIHRIYSGEKPQGEPLCISLHHAVHSHPLTNGYFQRMIAVRGQ